MHKLCPKKKNDLALFYLDGAGDAHGIGLGGRPLILEGTRDQFDIFSLFEILDREYNVKDATNSSSDTDTDSDSSSGDSDSGSSSEDSSSESSDSSDSESEDSKAASNSKG